MAKCSGQDAGGIHLPEVRPRLQNALCAARILVSSNESEIILKDLRYYQLSVRDSRN